MDLNKECFKADDLRQGMKEICWHTIPVFFHECVIWHHLVRRSKCSHTQESFHERADDHATYRSTVKKDFSLDALPLFSMIENL